MADEAERLRSLLEACKRVLPQLGRHDEDAAEVIRETCRAIEARLSELMASSAARG